MKEVEIHTGTPFCIVQHFNIFVDRTNVPKGGACISCYKNCGLFVSHTRGTRLFHLIINFLIRQTVTNMEHMFQGTQLPLET